MKNKTKKSIISLVLSFLLVLTTFAPALAAESSKPFFNAANKQEMTADEVIQGIRANKFTVDDIYKIGNDGKYAKVTDLSAAQNNAIKEYLKNNDMDIDTLLEKIINGNVDVINDLASEIDTKQAECPAKTIEDLTNAKAAMAAYLKAGGKETDPVYAALVEAIESKNVESINAATAKLVEATEALIAAQESALAEAIEKAEAAMSAYLNAGGKTTDPVYAALVEALESKNVENINAATAKLVEATKALIAEQGALAEAIEKAEAAMSAYLNAGGKETDPVYAALAEALESKNVESIKTATAKLVEATEAKANKIDNVNKLIEALPSVEVITIEYADEFGKARDAYDALSPEEQQLVKPENVEKLNAISEKMRDLDAVQVVIIMIDELDDTSETFSADVAAARAAYDALTESQKVLVNNLDVLTAAEARVADLEAPEKAEAAMSAYLKAGGKETDPAYTALVEALESKNVENIKTATAELVEATEALIAAQESALAEAIEKAETAMSAYLNAGGKETDPVYAALVEALESKNVENILSTTAALNQATEKLIADQSAELAQAKEAAEKEMAAYLVAGGSKENSVYAALVEAMESNNAKTIKAATAKLHEETEKLEAAKAAVAQAKEKLEAAQAEVAQAEEQVKAANSQVTEANEAKTAADSAVAQAKENLEVVAKTIGDEAADKVNAYTAAEAEVAQAEEQVKAAESKLAEANESLTNANAQVTEKKESVEAAKAAERAYLAAGGKETDDFYVSLEKALKAAEAAVAQAEEQVEAANSQIAEANEAKAAAVAAVAQAKENLEAVATVIGGKAADKVNAYKAAEAAVAQAEEQVKVANSQIAEANEALTTANAQVAEKNEAVEAAEAELMQAEEYLNSLINAK